MKHRESDVECLIGNLSIQDRLCFVEGRPPHLSITSTEENQFVVFPVNQLDAGTASFSRKSLLVFEM